jgi:hypothetical protein
MGITGWGDEPGPDFDDENVQHGVDKMVRAGEIQAQERLRMEQAAQEAAQAAEASIRGVKQRMKMPQNKTPNMTDIVAARKARLAAQQQPGPRPVVVNVPGTNMQRVLAELPDQVLLTMMIYADLSMTLVTAAASREYTADVLAAAAAKLPDDDVAKQLAQVTTVRTLVRSLMLRGLIAMNGDKFKLTVAGVMIGKAFKMSPERQILIDSLR